MIQPPHYWRRLTRAAPFLCVMLILAAQALASSSARGPSQAGDTVVASQASKAPAAATIWDGVYTEEQSDRGRATYRRACIYCHLPDLSGGSDAAAPALAGSRFLSKWADRTLADLFAKMAQTMPRDATDFGGGAPAEVKLEEYLDIVAFVLLANDVPPGKTELPPDERLERIMITRQRAP